MFHVLFSFFFFFSRIIFFFRKDKQKTQIFIFQGMESKNFQDQFSEHLLCPLTLELLNDPIHLPCCMKSVSRRALQQCKRTVCPMCNEDLAGFDIANAKKSVLIASMVDTIRAMQKQTPLLLSSEVQKSSPTPIDTVVDNHLVGSTIAELCRIVPKSFASTANDIVTKIDRTITAVEHWSTSNNNMGEFSKQCWSQVWSTMHTIKKRNSCYTNSEIMKVVVFDAMTKAGLTSEAHRIVGCYLCELLDQVCNKSTCLIIGCKCNV